MRVKLLMMASAKEHTGAHAHSLSIAATDSYQAHEGDNDAYPTFKSSYHAPLLRYEAVCCPEANPLRESRDLMEIWWGIMGIQQRVMKCTSRK